MCYYIFMTTRGKLIVGILAVALFGAGLWVAGVLPFGGAAAKAPSLDRPFAIPEEFSPEAGAVLEQNVAELKKTLSANPEVSDAWLDLAIYYKTANDLDGAIEIWKYLAEGKQNPIAYYNLGNSAHFLLKEYASAERYYKKAAELSPSVSINYIGLHELYRYSYKQNTTAAADVLNGAMDKVDIRGQVDLLITLGGYYKEKGDKVKALDAYTLARTQANSFGNTTLVEQLDREISSLQ